MAIPKTVDSRIKRAVDKNPKFTGVRVESMHLISSRQAECAKFMKRRRLAEENFIDFYIALHVVLEVSLNRLFREQVLPKIKKGITELEVMKNLDSISFLDKVTLFIYTSQFDLSEPEALKKATEYHGIINELKRFSALRNQLLHGHSISSVYIPGKETKHTRTRKAMSKEGVEDQIKMFKHIFEGMRFYIDHLRDLSEGKKGRLKAAYLNDAFLSNS